MCTSGPGDIGRNARKVGVRQEGEASRLFGSLGKAQRFQRVNGNGRKSLAEGPHQVGVTGTTSGKIDAFKVGARKYPLLIRSGRGLHCECQCGGEKIEWP